ncbi:uncharacterized protein BDZ99DRAFT_469768 [Mytilinidion resinicola]|uniref:Uncharacterized protein n=1 Tax=Mytilinidion resinicola TaxID=574789 RepID=A0A6A6XZD1_9PEZI|nr:uncharacterized protein BDZ99DRAFT_469768 [Mytilinidion resinicola]KAF2801335.1 hypothetical protein BDZ99DRAFT_469768 [Mytilinidion resinicola]
MSRQSKFQEKSACAMLLGSLEVRRVPFSKKANSVEAKIDGKTKDTSRTIAMIGNTRPNGVIQNVASPELVAQEDVDQIIEDVTDDELDLDDDDPGAQPPGNRSDLCATTDIFRLAKKPPTGHDS